MNDGSGELFDVLKNKFTSRVADLAEKNARAEQDLNIDLDLAPVYLQILKDKYPSARIVRLDTVQDLVAYVNDAYAACDKASLPLRTRAAVTVGRGHDVAVDIYGDENGVSLLILDSSNQPMPNFQKIEAEIRKAANNTPGPIKSVDTRSTGAQVTGFGCEMYTYHAIKQLIKNEIEITNLHLENLKNLPNHTKGVFPTDGDAIEFERMEDARGTLKLEFFKLMQEIDLLDNEEGFDTATVTHKNDRRETTKARLGRVFRQMFLGDDSDPNRTAIINDSLQRLRTRTYKAVTTLLDQIEQEHGGNASLVLRDIFAANTPMRPKNWEASIPSWVNGIDDFIAGPLRIFETEGNTRLRAMNPANQASAVCELIFALPTWQSPSLQFAALNIVQMSSDIIPAGQIGRVLLPLIDTQEHIASEIGQKGRQDLVESMIAAANALWARVPIKQMAEVASEMSTQSLVEMVKGEFSPQRRKTPERSMTTLEIMASHDVSIPHKLIGQIQREVMQIAKSNDTGLHKRLLQWFANMDDDVQKKFRGALEKGLPSLNQQLAALTITSSENMEGFEMDLSTQATSSHTDLVPDSASVIPEPLTEDECRSIENVLQSNGLKTNFVAPENAKGSYSRCLPVLEREDGTLFIALQSGADSRPRLVVATAEQRRDIQVTIGDWMSFSCQQRGTKRGRINQ